VKTLPRFLDLKPVKIDYRAANPIGYKQSEPLNPGNAAKSSKGSEPDLGAHWHAFYDMRGCKYFYNFKTEESLRRPTEEKSKADVDNDVTLVNLAQSRDAKKLKVYATKTADLPPGTKVTRKKTQEK
jgi:hypothetical protein